MKSIKPLGAPGLFGMVVVLFVLGLIGGLGSGFLSDVPGIGGLIGSGVVLIAVMVAVLLVTIWWWRRLDEAAREAHKWAWYWGGSAGMVIGLSAILTLTTRDVDLARFLPADVNAGDLIVGGMMSILLFQLVGYTLAWVWWWLARMRG
ncbi:hypothetical protein [uncultured Brevundimonas sp.]|uniref:hypothetical protein n=1 Tax=uncultured Brevundimonas sp. TaxID=213418 RepID=UPI0025F8A411|nr:hypothetical protein [uncultured Brevundimonas sp.]